MLSTTMGQVLVNEALPPEMRDYSRKLDKKGIKNLFQDVAERYPHDYRDISHKLSTIGHEAAYRTGGFSFGLKDMMVPPEAEAIRKDLDTQVQEILGNRKLKPDEKNKLLTATLGKRKKEFEDVLYQAMLKTKNPLAMQVLSGARGSAANLGSVLGGDLMYEDHRGRPIPIPVLHGYAQGLRPAEYWASAFGTRKGVADLKFATQEAGFFGKQLNQITHRLIVTAKDHDRPEPHHQMRGLPVDTNDPDNEGALLAQDVGRYKRHQVLTPRILKELHAKGHDKVLIRSPIVGGPPQGGLYATDVGVRDRGGLSPIGDYVGMAAAQSLSEPVTQAQICLSEHTLVRMADWSTKPIERIESGEMVLGADKAGRTFPVKVLRRFNNGERECYRTFFRIPFRRDHGGVTLESTLDHKLLVIRNVSNAHGEELNGVPQVLPVGTPSGRIRAVMPTGFDDYGMFHNEPFALLVGLLLGDGCYTEAVDSVNFSCFDETLSDDIAANLARLNLKLTKLSGHEGYYRVSQIEEVPAARDAFGQFMAGYRNPIRRWLSDREMLGKYAHEKELPPEVFGWDNKSVAELLSGLMITDGSVYTPAVYAKRGKPYLSYASTSLRMVQQFAELLAWRFGIYVAGPYDNTTGRKRTLYSVNITTEDGIRRFAAAIQLYGIKRVKLQESLTKWVVDRSREYYRLLRETQQPLGQLATFDLEVDHPDHLFVLANGLIVSNSSKHTGGVAGAGASVSGFKYINQLVQVPKTFQEGAAHAQADGKVGAIWNAPAGGKYLMIGGRRHYVHPNHEVRVKVGDTVEAGDVLSDGIPNPAEIVKHKGIGEGRRYFTKAFRNIYNASGMSAHRRNIELLARGLINHVRLTDELGTYVPDDMVPYDVLEHVYEPRPGHEVSDLKGSLGKYLEKPVLHYSIGTKVRPSMLPELQRFKVNTLVVHPDPPPFEPEMLRGMESLQHDPDWMTRQLGSNLKKSLLTAAHRGAVSNELGTSFVPPLARAIDFGRKGLTKGWDPKELKR
jgi:hypothetical protein